MIKEVLNKMGIIRKGKASAGVEKAPVATPKQAKVQNKAKPQQIMIGEDIFNKFHPTTQKNFELKVWNENEWNYRNRQTGKLYPVYGSKTKS